MKGHESQRLVRISSLGKNRANQVCGFVAPPPYTHTRVDVRCAIAYVRDGGMQLLFLLARRSESKCRF